MTTAEQLTAPDAVHGEGPVWWPGWGGLRWVDMLAGDILSLDGTSGQVNRLHVGKVAAALRPRRTGGMVIATEHDFVVWDDEGPQVVANPFDDPQVRFNDGGCDAEGNFFCGSMRYDEGAGGGTLYRLRPDYSVDVVLRDVSVSNGLEWSADGATAYYVDTATNRIDVFDYDATSGLQNRRVFAKIDGNPDGLTLDADGGVWVALWKGGQVRRYAASGALDEIIELPVSKVTACTFGGPDLAQLYITTSRYGEHSPHPAAGAIFVARPGTTGLPARPFAG